MVLDRSPLYALYLSLFKWLGYPTSVTVQYLVSGTFTIASIVILFRKYLGLKLAVFAGILWIPYLLQFAEPPVQALSLGAMCLAVAFRLGDPSRLRTAASYALLGIAALLRPTCAPAIGIFVAWDLAVILKRHQRGAILAGIRPRLADWPVGVVLILFVWFAAMQSPHPWNNVWAATTVWLPGNGKSLADSAFIQNFNVAYISRQYGSFEGKDFYLTNREIFGDANSMVDAIRANPGYVVKQVGENVSRLPGALLQLTEFHAPLAPFRQHQDSLLLRALLAAIYLGLSGAIVYGAFKAARDKPVVLFLVVSILLTAMTALSYVKTRWMYTMIPVLLMSAHWYGQKVHQWVFPNASGVVKNGEQDRKQSRWPVHGASLLTTVFLVLLSNGTSGWSGILNAAADDFRSGRVHILEQTYLASMKASFSRWHPLIRDCKGVLTLESTFTAAFADIPVSRVYDIWEVPPFGQLNGPDPDYNGLKPDRIDCVLVSEALSTETGGGSNIKIRYENYIRPYVHELQQMGARTYDIPRYGQLIKLVN